MELTADDVDMDDAEWSYQTHWATTSGGHVIPGQRSVPDAKSTLRDVHYLAVDTNILISHFPLFKSVYTNLALSDKTVYSHIAQTDTHVAQSDDEAPPTSLVLLIPYTVINELDGLGSRGFDDETLGIAARAATAFLLHAQRDQHSTKRKILHCQRWSERNDSSLIKPDDRILDCCLYFQARSLGVKLWTDDRNLALLAESNDISTIPGKGMTFDLLFGLAIGQDNTRIGTGTGIENAKGEKEGSEEGDMEVELDLQAMQDYRHGKILDIPHGSTTMKPNTNINDAIRHDDMMIDEDITITATATTTTLIDTTIDPLADIPLPSRIRKANQRRRPAQSLIDEYVLALQPIASSLHLPLDSSHPTPRLVNGILEALINLEQNIDSINEETKERHRLLLRAISSLRTINAFIQLETPTTTRRPRTGEVADAFLVLCQVLPPLGYVQEENVDALSTLAERTRQSL